ncbi:MAG: OmpA family protein [Terriglobales bacterium]
MENKDNSSWSGRLALYFVLIGALGAAFMGWLAYSGYQEHGAASAATVTAVPALAAPLLDDSAKAAWAALGEHVSRKLPDGTELSIPKLGVENRLLDFIEDSTKSVNKNTWFDFDRLLFDTGKATLQPASQEQLKNVAEIFKAYPKVRAKIGGYTDNTGSKEGNQKLSADRANNVSEALIGLGIDSSRLSAEGYGDQFPVADNSTEEGRAKNRRISLRVTAK